MHPRTALTETVLSALRQVLPGPCSLHEPEFTGNEAAYVKDCVNSGWVSSSGAFIDRFEAELAAFSGIPFAIATMNGTAALHLALRLLDVGADDEVICPALTFVATANAIAYLGARPHFADISERTLGLDPQKLEQYLSQIVTHRNGCAVNLETGRPLRAVICMHTFGHPVELDRLVEVCARFKLPLLEDAAESLGSYYKGRHTGGFGRIATLSFNGNKVVTTGGGGALLISDEILAKRARHLATTAKVPHAWEYEHDEVGYNYRLPNLNAALGCAQLERLPQFLEEKRRLAARYQAAFAGAEGLRFVVEPDDCKSNYWFNTICLDDAGERNLVLAATNEAGFMTRPAWRLMSRLEMFTDCPAMDLSVSEDLANRLINIPSSPKLARES